MQEQQIEMLEKRVKDLEETIASLMKFISMDQNTFAIHSEGDVSIQAQNIIMSAAVASRLKGESSAELSSSAETRVKGALVFIN